MLVEHKKQRVFAHHRIHTKDMQGSLSVMTGGRIVLHLEEFLSMDDEGQVAKTLNSGDIVLSLTSLEQLRVAIEEMQRAYERNKPF